MRIESASAYELPADIDAVGVPVVTGPEGPQVVAGVVADIAGAAIPAVLDADWCTRQGFSGKVGQTLVFRNVSAATSRLGPGDGARESGTGTGAGEGTAAACDTVLVGMGSEEALDGDAGLETLRRSAAAFVRAVGAAATGAFLLPSTTAFTPAAAAAAVAEGAVLAAYRFDRYRSGDAPGSLDLLLVTTETAPEATEASSGAQRGARLAASVALARDLVNEPPSSMTPVRFVETFARRFHDDPRLTVTVWDEHRLATERMGGILGVARGSVEPPRLLRVDYRPADPMSIEGRTPYLVLVGKGITFDSGGLSLKTATGMETMKTDMGGAAAVMAAVDAAADLRSRIRITAIAPLTENMPSGSATKPGDVLTARNGKTIEVLNTDAEGRLVLADALSLAAEAAPDAIVDLATLTGAAVVALGKEIAGLLGTDEGLVAQVEMAAAAAGEPVWTLPLPDDYRSHIESEVADMRNVGRPGQAGSIAAALLLREFVGEVPWAHLDIAGPARSDDNTRYLSKGGTGFGVRTLVAMATSEAFARSLVVDV